MTFLTDALSIGEQDSLNNGGEVQKTAVVKGVSTNSIPVMIRKCGNEIQARLSPVSVNFAAFCVGTLVLKIHITF